MGLLCMKACTTGETRMKSMLKAVKLTAPSPRNTGGSARGSGLSMSDVRPCFPLGMYSVMRCVDGLVALPPLIP